MASSSVSSSPAQASSSWTRKYDVFLSFRGEDTRKTFVDHFYSALVKRQIRTYKDDQALRQGESISPSLIMAIEESWIAVVIFSKNYADSSWCLEELAYIMKCKDERGLMVMPIFYDVEPTEVRKQKGKFGKAFARHEKKKITKVESWRKALVDASNITGWEPKKIANGHESKAINIIVDTILSRLFPLDSDVDGDLVGITARMQDLKSQLRIGFDGVRMLGIWGVGGSGKTTLAYHVYSKISHHFQGHCIIDNIREESSKHGLTYLQEKILSSLLEIQVGVQSVEEGKRVIRSRLCHSNMLIILDDVNDLEQLQALAGSPKWFGHGSRIVITTRDEHLLRTHKVDEVCPVRLLSNDEAMTLFNRHAYNGNEPIKDYKTLSLRAVSYAAGLPLALKVLGSFLYDKDDDEWMATLAKLKDIPDLKVMDKLKISYDGLETYQKELFLDIACFFRGYSSKGTDVAMEMLDACGFHPKIGIKVLTQKALITIVDGKFDMHDLVQELGYYIIRGEHPSNPENHSRVWKREEIENMCFGDATMENYWIEAIRYNSLDRDRSSRFCKIVSKMKKLRWLSVTMDEYAEGPTFLSNELRCIDWKEYPGSPFPDSFQPMKLVVLKLYRSLQQELWKGNKLLPHLKVLKLDRMKNLLRTPDFDGLPCLQELTLDSCDKLEEIHPSLGNHRSLEYVHISSCHKLRMFPKIVHMEELTTLKIKYCYAIHEFPKILANMKSLVTLYLENVATEVVPSSVGEHCTNLVYLYLIDCNNLKSIEFNLDALKHLKFFVCRRNDLLHQSYETMFHRFPHSLRKLDLQYCDLKDGEIPHAIVLLSNLEELDLSLNDFSRLDFSLKPLTQLKLLNVSSCNLVTILPELPGSLAILIADSCSRLKAIGDVYKNCKWLRRVSLVGGSIISDGVKLLEYMLQGKAIQDGTMLLQLAGVEIAKRFTPGLHDGNKYRLKLPENWCSNFCGFLMCAVFSQSFKSHRPVEISMKHVMSRDCEHDDDVAWKESRFDDQGTWVGYVSFASLRHTTWWDPTSFNTLSFDIDIPKYYAGKGNVFNGFGVRLLPKGDEIESEGEGGPMETSEYFTPYFNIVRDISTSLNISLGMVGYY